MQNFWSDKDAGAAIRIYTANGINEDIALRVYTTRLLGRDARLVQHGGGNTSVKTQALRAIRKSIEGRHCPAFDIDIALVDFFLQVAKLGIALVFIDVDEP